MDLGLREWMVLIGGLLILAVVVDGLRRMQTARKNTVKLSKRASKWNFDDDSDETHECNCHLKYIGPHYCFHSPLCDEKYSF